MVNRSDSTRTYNILVVVNSIDQLTLIKSSLEPVFNVTTTHNGWSAINLALAETSPDLILLDTSLPDIDGYLVSSKLKENITTAHIPVIFMTAHAQGNIDECFNSGAVDVVYKPIVPSLLLARINAHFELSRLRNNRSSQDLYLESEIANRTSDIIALQDVMIHALASLAETRDNETSNHIRRTQNYVKILAEHLRHHPKFSSFLDNDQLIHILYKSAPLHDIGKVGIPDGILLKPGRLDPAEFEIMKTHTTIGLNAIEKAEAELGFDVPFLKIAKEITYSHQEKWDGSGYPEGLFGEQIPISARLMALADVYDALKTRKVYKAAMSDEDVKEIMTIGRGSHFDPDVVDAFFATYDQFKAIEEQYKD